MSNKPSEAVKELADVRGWRTPKDNEQLAIRIQQFLDEQLADRDRRIEELVKAVRIADEYVSMRGVPRDYEIRKMFDSVLLKCETEAPHV